MPKVYQARWVHEVTVVDNDGEEITGIETCEKDDVGAFPALYVRENERTCTDPQYDFAEWDWVADFMSEERMRDVLADGLKFIPILPYSETRQNPNFGWRC